MLIRQETSRDYEKIYNLVKLAFETAEHSDGNECNLVNALRTSDAFVPQLALLAEVDGELAGHIMFTQGKVGEETVLVLAPLSVSPRFQKQGVGTALMAAAHNIAKEMGYSYSLVLGSELYYPRVGYLPAEQFNITVPEGINPVNFMAMKLIENAKPICGAVTYAKEFGMPESVDSRKNSVQYRYVDMETYPRKQHFEYFSSLAYPYVGTTVNIDVTDLLKKIKAKKISFFLTICYCAAKAANSVPELRQRIVDGRIIEFENCKTSHTVALEDGTFCYCSLDNHMPFSEYLAYAEKEQEDAKQKKSIDEEPADAVNKFFISTLPWLSFTALVQAVPMPADSNPRITWGKYFVQGDRVLMPMSILCHHALIDGIHIASFYKALDQQIQRLAAEL